MTITNAQATALYRPQAIDIYASALHWRALTNRKYQGDVATAKTLKLTSTNPSFSATERDRNSNRTSALPAMQRSATQQSEFDMRWTAQLSVFEYDLDLLEGPEGAIPLIMREQAYEMSLKADERIRSIVTAGILDANDGANTAGLRLGGTQEAIDSNGEPLGTNSKSDTLQNLVKVARRTAHAYRGANYWKLGDPLFDMRTPYGMIDNALVSSLGNYIDTAKPSDALVNEFFRSDGVSPAGVLQAIADVPFIAGNDVPLVTVSSKDYHQVMVSNPEATAGGFRNPELFVDQGRIIVETAADTFDRIIGWSSDMEATYGALVVNSGLLRRYLIRAEL